MSDATDAQRAANDWIGRNATRMHAAETPADLGKLTEELNAHLQAAGVVPVALPCGCCVLLGLELFPLPSPFGLFFDIRPIRQPADKDLH